MLERVLVRFFLMRFQKLAPGDDLRHLVALRKMSRVAGHKVICLGCLGAFKKSVVGFVRREGERLSWGNVVCNLTDSSKRLLNLSGFQF
jgi:hypothetical protein